MVPAGVNEPCDIVGESIIASLLKSTRSFKWYFAFYRSNHAHHWAACSEKTSKKWRAMCWRRSGWFRKPFLSITPRQGLTGELSAVAGVSNCCICGRKPFCWVDAAPPTLTACLAFSQPAARLRWRALLSRCSVLAMSSWKPLFGLHMYIHSLSIYRDLALDWSKCTDWRFSACSGFSSGLKGAGRDVEDNRWPDGPLGGERGRAIRRNSDVPVPIRLVVDVWNWGRRTTHVFRRWGRNDAAHRIGRQISGPMV